MSWQRRTLLRGLEFCVEAAVNFSRVVIVNMFNIYKYYCICFDARLFYNFIYFVRHIFFYGH